MGVEIDVRLVEGELLVMHDAKLDRTTNGRGYLARKPLAILRALDAGQGERIPTLREVFETVNRRAFINIEFKGRRTAGPVCALIQEFVRQPAGDTKIFSSPHSIARELRAVDRSKDSDRLAAHPSDAALRLERAPGAGRARCIPRCVT